MGPAPGPWNMAVDEAVMLSLAREEAVPTLRLYGWRPRCLSVGYFQRINGALLERCRELGIEWVRRPTGGRALLHDAELTYSLALPEAEPCAAGEIRESYRRLSQALLVAFRGLGVPAVVEQHRRQEGLARSDACFDAPGFCEITVQGKKLAGAAQMRRGGALLQHGSIPLQADWDTMETLLGHDGLRQRATTVSEALGRTISWEEMADVLAAAFGEALDIQLEVGGLTREEKAQAEELVQQKYARSEWNRRR